MAALTLLTIGLFFISVIGVIFLFYRKEQESKKLLSTEKELQKMTDHEKEKLMTIIGSLNDGIVVFDSTNSVSFINTNGKKFLNIPTDNPGFSDIVSQFPQPIHFSEKLNEAFTYNRMVTLSEVTIHERIFRVYINPVYQKEQIPNDGTKTHVTNATMLMQDITHEKQLEKMREDFTHMVIHELRAPLTAIKDAAALLDGTTGDLEPEDQKKLLKLVYEQSKMLLTQVSTILDAGKIESGKFSVQKTLGDIGGVIQGEVSFFMPEAQRKQITLIAEVGNDLPKIPFDPVRITQVITNLISNSLKYTNPGGTIKVTVDKKHPTSPEQEELICVTVSDNGIGIPEEKQQFLFTKYAEIGNDKSKRNVGQSTGLGMYIAKGIVEAHGGTVSVQSALNQGTTIALCLPVQDKNPKQPLVASVRPQTGSTLPQTAH